MRIPRSGPMCMSAALVCLFAMPSLRAQTPPAESEIPLQRCDRLPVAVVEVNKAEKRFLVDTAATSMLNQKSFKSGRSTGVRVQSWNKTTSLNAREVVVSELSLGDHHLQNLKLPAIDLSAIAKACGGRSMEFSALTFWNSWASRLICNAASRGSAFPLRIPLSFR
jgi:hypothetical protein